MAAGDFVYQVEAVYPHDSPGYVECKSSWPSS